jgi:hypothetical protein
MVTISDLGVKEIIIKDTTKVGYDDMNLAHWLQIGSCDGRCHFPDLVHVSGFFAQNGLLPLGFLEIILYSFLIPLLHDVMFMKLE